MLAVSAQATSGHSLPHATVEVCSGNDVTAVSDPTAASLDGCGRKFCVAFIIKPCGSGYTQQLWHTAPRHSASQPASACQVVGAIAMHSLAAEEGSSEHLFIFGGGRVEGSQGMLHPVVVQPVREVLPCVGATTLLQGRQCVVRDQYDVKLEARYISHSSGCQSGVHISLTVLAVSQV